MTRRTAGNPTANLSNKGPGKPQQTNRNNVQKRPGTGKPSAHASCAFSTSTELTFFTLFLVVRSTAEDRPASTSAPPGCKKTGGRPPVTHVHAAPIIMDDGSDVDVPATANQDRNLPAVTHTCRQAQVLKKSTTARQGVHASHRAVVDDEEEVIEQDIITDQEDEDEDNIYDGATGDALGNEVGQLSRWHVVQVLYMSADDLNFYS